MIIAIVDTGYTGHHLEYLYGICNQIRIDYINKEWKFHIYCNQKLNEYISENNLQPIDDIPNLKIVSDILLSPTGNWIQKTNIAYRNIRKLSDYEYLIFLTINVYFPALSINSLINNSKFRFSGIYFNPFIRSNSNLKNVIRDIILRRITRKYKNSRIFVLNDNSTTYELNQRYGTEMFRIIEDPIPTYFYNNTCYNDRTNQPVTYLMIGNLSKRKGVLEYLKAIEFSKKQGRHILAGKLTTDIHDMVIDRINFMNKNGHDIELYNSFIPNKLFAELIDNADVLVMPYLSKGASSGILGHAAYRKKIVIGPNIGLLAELIKEYDLGICIDPNNIGKFGDIIDEVQNLIDKTNYSQHAKYCDSKSYKNFFSKLISFSNTTVTNRFGW